VYRHASTALGYGQNLGDIRAISMDVIQAKTDLHVSTTIALWNIQATTTVVNATFSGTASTDDLNDYKNTTSTGPQTVSIQLAKTDGTLLKNGDSYGDVATGAAKFTVKARLYTEKGQVLPGAVTSAIDLTFQYK